MDAWVGFSESKDSIIKDLIRRVEVLEEYIDRQKSKESKKKN